MFGKYLVVFAVFRYVDNVNLYLSVYFLSTELLAAKKRFCLTLYRSYIFIPHTTNEAFLLYQPDNRFCISPQPQILKMVAADKIERSLRPEFYFRIWRHENLSVLQWDLNSELE